MCNRVSVSVENVHIKGVVSGDSHYRSIHITDNKTVVSVEGIDIEIRHDEPVSIHVQRDDKTIPEVKVIQEVVESDF
jgi:hypothetical protein